MTNLLLETALNYASAYGWAVFPVSSKTKKPLTPHGCLDAKKEPGPIKAWWGRWPKASIGIATGSISNLIVIDEDIDEDKGLDGYHEVCAWEKVHGTLPETVMAITGRGGNHLYYHYTGNDIRNRAGLLDGVDVRGEGGYVIAPPSVHPNGTEYQWENAPEEVPIAEVDDVVKAFLKIGNRKADSDRDYDAETHEAFTVPQVIQSGQRNETLFRLACKLQNDGLPDSAILAAVRQTNLEQCVDPLPNAEVEQIVGSALRYAKGELKVLSSGMPEWHEPQITETLDKDGKSTGKPAQTINNAEEAITFDQELYGRIRYNEIAYAPYVRGNLPWRTHSGWREWTDADDSNLRGYLESRYGLKNKDKIMDGLNNVMSKYRFNPIKETLEGCHEIWDGNKHVEDLLPMMLGAEKTEYNTAVMRLILLGAVARIYEPGCKFDYMAVLNSPQGLGKSSFVKFLSLSAEWFLDSFNSFDGDKAAEKLRGRWFVEVAELQAFKRAKDVETIKAFITSQYDVYRVPYGRRTEQRPRGCIFIGTTNDDNFLIDKTGNRRFLPIKAGVNKPTFDMYADPVATKAIFCQCYGEIMDEFLRTRNNLQLVMPKELLPEIEEMQESFEEDDPDVGIIQKWLDGYPNDRVCAKMIWNNALNQEQRPKRAEINHIHEIMKHKISGWHSVGKQYIDEDYGVQKAYERLEQFRAVNAIELPDELTDE